MSAPQPPSNTVAEAPTNSPRRAIPLALVVLGGILCSAIMAFAVRNHQPVVLFAGGIVFTALLVRLLFLAQQRTLTVQRLVRERTAELHATQEKLREDVQERQNAEERYRAFVEQSREAIWRFELQEPLPLDLSEDAQIAHYYKNAYLAEANDAFAWMYGYERAKEMIGVRLADLMPQGDSANIRHLRQYVRNAFRLTNSESHEVGRSGEVRIFLNNITGIIENGHLARTWGTQLDVTDQRRAEEERRRAEARLATALAAADLGTWEWNLRTDSITGSETTERIFGFARGTFRGGLAQYLELIDPDHRELVERRLRQVAREGGSVDWEAKIVRRDGASRWISSRGDVIRNDEGLVLRVVGVVLDITEQHEAAEVKAAIERRLQESQKLESLGILAGGIAHDFNNLLTGILGNTSLARLDLPEDSPVHAYVQAIEHASRRAADLCKQMLAYSGKGRLLVQRLDLSEIARETAQLIRPSISKAATLEFDLASDLPAISADATQMRQIIMNLVINASDALGENPGVIRLTTGLLEGEAAMLSDTVLSPEVTGGDFVFLAISDTGCGMTPEVREKIFDPFFTTKFTGRGLGLAAVIGIVRSHGGALKVTSTLGQGSTFQLLLPCAAGVAEPLRSRVAPASTWRGTGTVLVVDDEETVRGVASRSLVTFGFEVVLATNGREAIASFREDPARFCAVLLDLTMPEMGGAETFAELRRISPAVKVVLMSGFTEQDAVGRFHSNDLAGFVSKPFTPEELRERFQSIFPEAGEPRNAEPSSGTRAGAPATESAALGDGQRANGSTGIGSPQ